MSTKQPITRYFRPGQYIFNEGDASECMYLITKGTVSVRKEKEGAEIELSKVYPSEVLGELSFFDRNDRSASAVAIGEVEAMEILFEDLDQIYTQVPDYIKNIFTLTATRLRRANNMIRNLEKRMVTEAPEKIEEKSIYDLSTSDVLKLTEEVTGSEEGDKNKRGDDES